VHTCDPDFPVLCITALVTVPTTMNMHHEHAPLYHEFKNGKAVAAVQSRLTLTSHTCKTTPDESRSTAEGF